jgi:hypothetical protein
VRIYFWPYGFGDFLLLSACMWWICYLFILMHCLNILSLNIKTDKNPLNSGVVLRSYFSIQILSVKKDRAIHISTVEAHNVVRPQDTHIL